MSKLIQQLTGDPEEAEPRAPRAQQLELLGPLPVSIKDPPSITASIPPRNKTFHHGRSQSPVEPMLTPPDEVDKLRAALVNAETRDRSAAERAVRIQSEAEAERERVRSENEDRLEALRLEILSLRNSLEGERGSRLAGEQRIRELDEQLRATPAVSLEDSIETRQALDKAQTQLDDLRSQFRHVESSHEQQAHQAELRGKELTAILDREKKAQTELQHEAARKHQALLEQNRNLSAALEKAGQELTAVQCLAADRESTRERELTAARVEIERLAGEAESLKSADDFEAELLQARVRLEELETRLCSEAELRVRAERKALDAQALREQEAIQFQERDRLSARRLSASRRGEPPSTPQASAPSALLRLGLVFLLLIGACAASFLLGRWQGMGRLGRDAAGRAVTTSVSPVVLPGPASGAPPPALKTVPWPSLKGNFMQVQQTSDRMTVVFGYAVFSRRTEIHPDALRDLQKLARQLAPVTRDFRIEIAGHTDADPVMAKAGEFSNNVELGLKRAQTVRDVLIRQGGLPAAALSAVSAGELNPPYPNTTDELRKKNRTVTIALIPK